MFNFYVGVAGSLSLWFDFYVSNARSLGSFLIVALVIRPNFGLCLISCCFSAGRSLLLFV